MSSQDPTMDRLDDQINWYDGGSRNNQQLYKWLKGTSILAAVLVPIVALSGAPPMVAALLGGLIAIAEGIQSLNQYHSNWIGYRSTAEALKHEKFLYLAKAGDYATAKDPHALLAERIESLISHEHAKWVSGRQEADKTKQTAKSLG